MAKFTFWGDIFKFSTDVLDEGYAEDKNFSIKAKTKSTDGLATYNFKLEQTKPDDQGKCSNSMELKNKLSFTHVTSENKFKTGGKVSSENEFHLHTLNDQMKGWSYVLTANLVAGQTLDKSSFASGVKYQQSNLEAKLSMDHSSKGVLEAEATFQPRADSPAVVGGTATLNLKNHSLDGYNLAFVNKFNNNFSFGLHNWSSDGKEYGNFRIYTLQNVNTTTDVATSISYSLNSKKLAASAGFAHQHSLTNSFKGKVHSDGILSLAFKHQIGLSSYLTLSTAFDLGSKTIKHQNPHPFGVALESTF